MFFAPRLFHIPVAKRMGGGAGKKCCARFSDEETKEIRMNKYIQRNALANEIITIKRFTTIYAITLRSVTGIMKEREIYFHA